MNTSNLRHALEPTASGDATVRNLKRLRTTGSVDYDGASADLVNAQPTHSESALVSQDTVVCENVDAIDLMAFLYNIGKSMRVSVTLWAVEG